MMKKNRLFWIVTALLLLIVPAVLLTGAFALPSRYDDTFLGELKYKCRRLDETEGRRIVLVGGSAVAFGVDSGLIEQELPGFTAVNFGMYAALGTRVMLDLSEGSLRPGDVVVLCPEQQAQTLSGYLGAEALWQGLDGAFSLLARVDRRDYAALTAALPAFAASKLKGWISGEAFAPEGVYARASFDAYGDMISPLCAANVMPGGYDTNMPIRFAPELLAEDFVAAVNGYADRLARRGVTVLYHFCPMNALAVEEGADIDAYAGALESLLRCRLIGDPSNSVMDAAWFYDTNFHLNADGKTVFTRQLIRDIKAFLGDSSPTRVALPQPPSMELAALETGSNEDAGCFTYVVDGGTAVLTALTQEGALRREVTVPVSIDGYPVTALSASVFAGNGVVETVTLQDNIRRIEDRAFDGCASLRALVLTQRSPERCSVGSQLLKGADAVIRVPQSAVTAYKLNYFWSPYAGKIQAL